MTVGVEHEGATYYVDVKWDAVRDRDGSLTVGWWLVDFGGSQRPKPCDVMPIYMKAVVIASKHTAKGPPK